MIRSGRGGTGAGGWSRPGLLALGLAVALALGLAALSRWGSTDGGGTEAVGIPAPDDSDGGDDRLQLESPPDAGAEGARTDALAAGRSAAGGRRASLSGRVFARSATYDTAKLERLGPGLVGTSHPDLRDPELVEVESPRGFVKENERVLADVEVIARDSARRSSANEERRTRTDERGEYRFDHLPPGHWMVDIEPPWGVAKFGPRDWFGPREVSLDAGEAAVLDFPLLALVATLAGRVVDTALLPVAGASVTGDTLHTLGLVRGESYGDVRLIEAVRATTDDQGRYELTGVLPASFEEARAYFARGELSRDAYTVSAAAAGHCPARVVVLPILPNVAEFLMILNPGYPSADGPLPTYSEGRIQLPDIVLAESASVAGVVVTPGGEGFPHARVHLLSTAHEAAIPPPLTPVPIPGEWVQADEDGAFRIADVAPGEYVFEVTSPDTGLLRAKNPPFAVVEGARIEGVHVLVRTDEKGTIAGTVVDEATGAAVKDFTVQYTGRDGSACEHRKGGAFRLERVPAGPTSLQVKASRYAVAELSIDVRGGTVSEVRVPLHRSGTVEGRLTVDGSPASGTVYAQREDGARRDLAGGSFKGNYRIEGLESGRPYSLVAYLSSAKSLEGELVAHASVVPDAGEVVHQEFEVQLPASAIRGAITAPDANARWQVFAFEGPSLYLEDPHLSPYLRAMAGGVGASGRFELPVAPGTYTVLARRLAPDVSGAPVRERELSRRVTVTAATPATADFDLE